MAFSDFFQKLKDRLSGAGQMARTPDFAESDRPEFFRSLGQPDDPYSYDRPVPLGGGVGMSGSRSAMPPPDPVTSAVDPNDWRIRDKAAVLPSLYSQTLSAPPMPEAGGPASPLPPAEDNPLAPRNQQWFNKVKPYMDQAAGGDPIAQREAQAVISGTKINPTKMDRFKQIILPALAGMAQGGANGNGWSGLGGAIAGGLTGAINPQAGAAYRYKTFQQPQDEQMIARENMRVKMERDNQLAQAKAQQEGAAADLARARAAQARRAPLPQMVTSNTTGFRDPVTGAVTPNSLYTPPKQLPQAISANTVGFRDPVTGAVTPNSLYRNPDDKPLSEADIAKKAEAEVAANLDVQKAQEQFVNDMRTPVYSRLGITPEEAQAFAKGYPGKRQVVGADGKPTMVDASENEVKQYQSIAQRINGAESVLRDMAKQHAKTLQDKMTAEVANRYHQNLSKPAPSTSARPRKPADLIHLFNK